MIENSHKVPVVVAFIDSVSAHYEMAICELVNHKIDDAMEHFFFIQQQKPDYKEDAARKMIISVIGALVTSDSDSAKSYRRKLSSLING